MKPSPGYRESGKPLYRYEQLRVTCRSCGATLTDIRRKAIASWIAAHKSQHPTLVLFHTEVITNT